MRRIWYLPPTTPPAGAFVLSARPGAEEALRVVPYEELRGRLVRRSDESVECSLGACERDASFRQSRLAITHLPA